MDGYHIALYIHLLALVGASCAASLTHFAEGRRGRAASAGEALQWHRVVGVTARTFPIVIVALLATGGYMVSAAGNTLWATAWVRTGVVVSVLLFVIGGFMGARGKRMARALAEITQNDPAATAFPTHDSAAHTLSWLNTGMAIGVVGVMAMKPDGFACVALVAVCGLLGIGISLRGGHAAATAADLARE